MLGIYSEVYALNLNNVKTSFLKGDYKQAISEGEKLVGQSDQSAGSDELYYLLGLSYLKDGNYLRASDIFEIILREFPGSAFKEEASLGLADTYLFRTNFAWAEARYKDMLLKYPQTKFRPQIYYRLSKISFKNGDTQAAKEYLEKLNTEFPSNIESLADSDVADILKPGTEIYYTVQVGSFEDANNARALRDKLAGVGFDAFIDESSEGGRNVYRVRVGKLKMRPEAIALQDKLSRQGYPTKICP